MKSYKDFTEEDVKNILDLYYKNVDFFEIRKILNISERGMFRCLRENGINTKRKNRYSLNESFFKNIDTEEKAYILGFIYADGYVGDNKTNNVVITVTRKDKCILEEIKKCLEYTGEIRNVDSLKGCYENTKPKSTINFSSKELAEDLRKLGLYPNKSTSMTKLPDIPLDLYRHFIRGYFDGDGCISTSQKTSYHILSDGSKKKYINKSIIWNVIGTIEFLDDMKKYLPTNVLDAKCKTDGMKYLRTDSKKALRLIYKFMYDESTIYLKRKYKKFTEMSPDIK